MSGAPSLLCGLDPFVNIYGGLVRDHRLMVLADALILLGDGIVRFLQPVFFAAKRRFLLAMHPHP